MTRPMLTLALLLALPLTAAAQQQGPPQGPPVQDPSAAPPTKLEDLYGEWLNLDGVALVVNSDIITINTIERKYQEKQAGEKISTAEEYRALRNETTREELKLLLMRQAGEDLGLAPEAVEAHVAGVLRDEQDAAGGAFEMSRRLREDNTTVTEQRKDRVAEIYETSWRRRIAGYGAQGERNSEDRYVRPGTLAQRYLRIGRTGRDIRYLRRVGATPATYELQALLFAGQDYGTLEATLAKAEEVLTALRAGDVDWEEMLDSLGRLENRGLLPPRGIEFIQAMLDPGDNHLVQFAMEGNLDVYSDVIRFPSINQATGERRVAGYVIYKLIGRQAAHMPGFGARGVQRDLRLSIQREGDQLLWDDAVAELESIAYVWYPGWEERQKDLAAQHQERLDAIQAAREQNAKKLQQQPEQP